MPEAYRESLAALKERLRVAQSDVFSAFDLAVAPTIRATYPQWIEDELTEAVRSGEQEQAGRWVQRFLREVFQVPLGEQEYRFVFIRLLAALLRELPNDTNPGTLFSASHPLNTELFALKTADELETWFQMRVIEPIMRVIEQYREPQRKSIAERVKMMIDEEYDQDLSLEVCAARLHYHPGYVKTSFRKEMGMSFSECLALKRLTMAKRWLVETDMRISDIADRLRYNNPQNFIRAFRKSEDMTPGQYREQRREFPTS